MHLSGPGFPVRVVARQENKMNVNPDACWPCNDVKHKAVFEQNMLETGDL
jgi:hypothetical protein